MFTKKCARKSTSRPQIVKKSTSRPQFYERPPYVTPRGPPPDSSSESSEFELECITLPESNCSKGQIRPNQRIDQRISRRKIRNRQSLLAKLHLQKFNPSKYSKIGPGFGREILKCTKKFTSLKRREFHEKYGHFGQIGDSPEAEPETASEDSSACSEDSSEDSSSSDDNEDLLASRYNQDRMNMIKVRRYQKTGELLIREKPFRDLVKELLQDVRLEMEISKSAISAIQEAAEAYLVKLFRNSNYIAISGGNEEIQLKDLHVAKAIMEGVEDFRVCKYKY